MVTTNLSELDRLVTEGHYADAVEGYRQAVADQPALWHAWMNLAICELKIGNESAALDAGRKAAALAPDSAETRYCYAFVLGTLGRFEDALSELDATLWLQPNHGPARAALLYSLEKTATDQLKEGHGEVAAQRFDRLLKLQPANPRAFAGLLEANAVEGRAMKVVALLKDASPELKNDPKVTEIVDRLKRDPQYQNHLRVANSAGRPIQSTVNPAAPDTSIKFVACPGCSRPIADYAAICPHCNHHVRPIGTFSDRVGGNVFIWQEIGLTIASVIWSAFAGLGIYFALQQEHEMLRQFLTVASLLQLGVGLGMLLRIEWVMFVGKIICYLGLLRGSYGFMVNLFMGGYLAAIFSLLELGLNGLLVYLINYNSD